MSASSASSGSKSVGEQVLNYGSVSRATSFPLLFSSMGVTSVMLLNRIRFQRTFFQPWLHVGAGLIGLYMGSHLGAVFDDTESVVHRQLASYVVLPAWVHSQLSPEDLAAELKRKRLEELRGKFAALSALEEAEYKAKVAGMSGEEVAAEREAGKVRLA